MSVTGLSICKSKIYYRSRKAARKAKWLLSQNKDWQDSEVYKCDYCDGFHLTTAAIEITRLLYLLKRTPEDVSAVTQGTHFCNALHCQYKINHELLMCGKHWRMVPKRIQLAIWNAYRPGQYADQNPSKAWLQAAGDAIRYVAAYEKGIA